MFFFSFFSCSPHQLQLFLENSAMFFGVKLQKHFEEYKISLDFPLAWG